jgi:tRNA(Arg) A34 adenosine deaminase TadA
MSRDEARRKPDEGTLPYWLDHHVKTLLHWQPTIRYPAERERHRLYSLLLMALVHYYWNGNKRGREGEYPWRQKQRLQNGLYKGGDYLGHNIASLAVDRRGDIIDFDFNHNDILRSTVEHAEARLIRRLFSLAQIHEGWQTSEGPGTPKDGRKGKRSTTSEGAPYNVLLNGVTVYTSLESCSQCSGIMALGLVREVVYLQRDPGQNQIGNILWNLSRKGPRGRVTHHRRVKDSYPAPRPIPASAFGFEYFDVLNRAFAKFSADVKNGRNNKPFYRPKKGPTDRAASVTSFLCTDDALDQFAKARTELEDYLAGTKRPEYPNFPTDDPTGTLVRDAMTNASVLNDVRRFWNYATNKGFRGTPHKL